MPRTPTAAPRHATRPQRTRNREDKEKYADFEGDAFMTALDSTRAARGMTWKDVAGESGVSASTLTRMAQGKHPDVDGLAALLAWSGLDAGKFLRTKKASPKAEPLAEVLTYFRRDPRLSRESALALEEVVKVTYERMLKERR